MRVLVASMNPVKIEAVRQGFCSCFPALSIEVVGVAAVSGVSDQPTSDAETFQGAYQRVNAIFDEHYDFCVGVEGGIDYQQGEMIGFAWIVIRSIQGYGKARTATFFLPSSITHLVSQGVELGVATDQVFNSKHSKRKGGAVGALTNNLITRTELYAHAVILAMIPFMQADELS